MRSAFDVLDKLDKMILEDGGLAPVTTMMGGTKVRIFDSGATRDQDADKLDYEGFLSPRVLQRFAEYMHTHRVQPDGRLRDSDNWQRGMSLESYMKSGFRHFMDWWRHHRGLTARETLEEALCGILFNVQGYLHEILKAKETR